jgi:hypothetical protein
MYVLFIARQDVLYKWCDLYEACVFTCFNRYSMSDFNNVVVCQVMCVIRMTADEN